MRRKCQERFPHHHRLAIPTCITTRASMHVVWCMPGSLTNGFIWSRWRGKRSRYSGRTPNPQFYVSGKRPMAPVVGDFYPEKMSWSRRLPWWVPRLHVPQAMPHYHFQAGLWLRPPWQRSRGRGPRSHLFQHSLCWQGQGGCAQPQLITGEVSKDITRSILSHINGLIARLWYISWQVERRGRSERQQNPWAPMTASSNSNPQFVLVFAISASYRSMG